MTAAGLRTVPGPVGGFVEVTAELRHLCPFVEEVDRGTVTLVWETLGATLELHALRAYLDLWAGVTISHEYLAEAIRADLAGTEGLRVLDVRTSWTTAGMGVACSTSLIHAGRP